MLSRKMLPTISPLGDEAQSGDHRNQGVAQDVANDNAPHLQALHLGRAYVIHREYFKNRGAGLAYNDRQGPQSKNTHGQNYFGLK